MKIARLLFGSILAVLFASPTIAQTPPSGGTLATVLNTCGTGAPAASVGQRAPIFRDLTGNLCTSSTAVVAGGVTANAGLNLNTSALALESGGNLATIASTVSGAKLQVNVATIAAALHASTNVDQIGGSAIALGQTTMASSLPVAIASNQGALTVAQATAANLQMTCANCSGSGVVQTDTTTFIPATSFFATVGGFFQTNPKASPLANLQMGTAQLTAQRAMFVNLRDALGNEWNLLNPLPIVDTTLAPAMQNMNLNMNLATVGTKLFFLGPNTQANSIPIVDASDQPARLVRQNIASQLNATVVEPVLDATVSGGKVVVTATNLSINLAQVSGNAALTAGVNGTLAIGGNQATGSLLSTEVFPILIAGSDYAGTPHKQGWKVDTSGSGYVNCSNCTGSGVTNTDQTTWIAGVSQFASGGGFFQTNPKANPLTTLQMGTFQTTAYRALFTNLRDATGNELGTFAAPLTVQNWNEGNVIAAALASGRQLTQKSISFALAWDHPPLPSVQRDSTNNDATDPLAHAVVVSPYAPRGMKVRGAIPATGAGISDGTAHTLIAGVAGLKLYVTGVHCFRTDVGTAMDFVILNDTVSTPIALPPSGGSNPDFITELLVPAGTALTMTVSAPIASVYCDAQGYYAQN